MSRLTSALAAVVVASAPLVGCGSHDEAGRSAASKTAAPSSAEVAAKARQEPARRRVASSRWDTVLVLGGQVQDTLFRQPRRLGVFGDRLYVYDYLDHRLLAFDRSNGKLQWMYGRNGKGPDEIGNVLDLDFGSDGAVWLNDAVANRLAIVAPDGARRKLVPLGGRTVRDVVPFGRTAIVTPIGASAPFWIEVDESGAVTDSARVPKEFRGLNWFYRQTMASKQANGTLWAVLLPWARPFFVWDGKHLRCRGELIEGRPPPAVVDQSAPVWAVATAIVDSTLYILAKGETDKALRTLDAYSMRDCRYLESYLLPAKKFKAMAAARGPTFYVEFEDPVPTVIGLRAAKPR
ncbi:MAG: hypothetical protein Q8W47_05800 [Candidatus Palauibacterales bacterium]|nr:hypothetical protein [Candidatus Palauibacterales bacterium]